MILFLLITVPDLANLLPATCTIDFNGKELNAPWVVWLAAEQLSMALLCVLVDKLPRTHGTLTLFFGGALLYALEALDQLAAGDFFSVGLWKYPVIAVFLATLTFIIRKHDTRKAT